MPIHAEALDRRYFSGMNAILLSSLGAARGYESAYWLTFQQALELGGHVRKGEKAAPAILYKTRVVDGDASEGSDDRVLRFLRAYGVFNAAQIEGLPERFYPLPREAPEPLRADIASIMAAFPVTAQHGGDVACYNLLTDRITMPQRADFASDEDYIATLLHEYGHSTGAKDRLDHFSDWGSQEAYAREELVAELTSHLTSMHLGINPTQGVFANHVAYLGHWARLLKDRPTELLKAAGKAQAAADFILRHRAGSVDETSSPLPRAAA